MTDEKDTKPASSELSKVGEELKELLKDKTYLQIPKSGDLVKGTVIAVSKNEVKIDLPGYRTGVVRGNEMYNESEEFGELKIGDEIEATVVDLENENGDVELSFRFAGQQKTWTRLEALRKSGERVKVKITEANKGGLMTKLFGIQGFIPVSQLSPDNYPRVQGGDKGKILERLRKLIGTEVAVKVLDALQAENKLIFSEKQVWEEEQKENIAKYKVGDMVDGQITAVTDFGVFVKFNDLEGLIHISELAWQRIENPQELYKIGDTVRAVIVNIQGSRIFLSTKRLQDDPWKGVETRYQIGQKVSGKVLKKNPFGLFVELDKDIHGLAHVSELGEKNIDGVEIGSELEFYVISIEPKEHRLGLSFKKPEKAETAKKEEPKEKEEAALSVITAASSAELGERSGKAGIQDASLEKPKKRGRKPKKGEAETKEE